MTGTARARQKNTARTKQRPTHAVQRRLDAPQEEQESVEGEDDNKVDKLPDGDGLSHDEQGPERVRSRLQKDPKELRECGMHELSLELGRDIAVQSILALVAVVVRVVLLEGAA